MNKLKNYFFTFGQNHRTHAGEPMKDYWVKVTASSYGKARELFIEEFSSRYMPQSDSWAFQYSEKQFTSAYFYKGEYTSILEKTEVKTDETLDYF